MKQGARMDVFRQSIYAQPWRSAFEANAAAVWMGSSVFSLWTAMTTDYPSGPFFAMAAIAGGFGVVRAAQASEVWNLRINLLGKGMMLMPVPTFLSHCDAKPDQLWLGKGFLWQRHHTQRLYDLRRTEEKLIRPPDWYINLRGKVFEQQDPESAGLPYIHGVSEKEDDIHLPFALLEGNSLILGTTGSGKSTLLRIIIAACIRRGDCVIVIDPKGDRSLVDVMRKTCAQTPGREKDFVYFHTAFPSQSVRYDILKNFDRETSIASRISAQIPSRTGGSDPFVNFSWNVILVYAQLLVACGERPTISKIRKYVELGGDSLLERALVQHFESVRPTEWRGETERFLDMAKNDKLPRPQKTTPDRIVAYVEYYKQVLAQSHRSEAVEAGVSMFFLDRTNFGKMINSLRSTLAMLDAGELGGVLSPRYDDVDDHRSVTDSEKIIEGNKCFYMGLDALSDSMTSSAVGSITVADMAAFAGARYNFGREPRRVTFIVDEANEVVSAPYHQLASKGRGAGFTLWAASQTIPDFIAKLGSQEKALATLGNFNNLICLRVKDAATTLFVSEQIGKAFVDSKTFSLNTSSQSESAGTGFTGGEGVAVKDALIEVVPPDILGMLPNHQYFALLAGGRLYKGRQQVLT